MGEISRKRLGNCVGTPWRFRGERLTKGKERVDKVGVWDPFGNCRAKVFRNGLVTAWELPDDSWGKAQKEEEMADRAGVCDPFGNC